VAGWKKIGKYGNTAVVRYLVAAKCDSPDPAVTLKDGEELAQSLGLHFMACSAKTNENVDKLFDDVARSASYHVNEHMQEKLRLQTPMAVTVLASRNEAGEDGVRLVALSLAGAELGQCHVEYVHSSCTDGLSRLRASMHIDTRQAVKFVSVGAVALPSDPGVEYEEDSVELVFIMETQDDVDNIETQAEPIFKREALHVEDTTSGTVIDKDGNDFDNPSTMAFSDLAAGKFPVTIKVNVKRRKTPMTLAGAFNLGI
jgi:hypothetical protein